MIVFFDRIWMSEKRFKSIMIREKSNLQFRHLSFHNLGLVKHFGFYSGIYTTRNRQSIDVLSRWYSALNKGRKTGLHRNPNHSLINPIRISMVPTFSDWQICLTLPVFFAVFQYFFKVLFLFEVWYHIFRVSLKLAGKFPRLFQYFFNPV